MSKMTFPMCSHFFSLISDSLGSVVNGNAHYCIAFRVSCVGAVYIIIFNLTAMMTKCQKLWRKCQQYAHVLSEHEKNDK